MNLISCDLCGVVLDASKLKFPKEIYKGRNEEVDLMAAKWNGWEWVAKVPCPVCGGDILNDVAPK